MATLSDAAIARYAKNAGFSGNGLVTAVAVALAESQGDPLAKHVNTDGSIDRGLWQINNAAHPSVTDTCAYNPKCAAGQAYTISTKGTIWKPWVTYKTGEYRAYTSRALAAAQNVGAISGTPAPPPGPPNIGTPSVGGAPLSYQTVTLADVLGGSTKPTYAKMGLGTDVMSAYKTILALVIMFGFLFVIAKTRIGYTAIYYGELLILFFLFVTQAQFFKEALLPLAPQPSTS